jgi:hypothetical protein
METGKEKRREGALRASAGEEGEKQDRRHHTD